MHPPELMQAMEVKKNKLYKFFNVPVHRHLAIKDDTISHGWSRSDRLLRLMLFDAKSICKYVDEYSVINSRRSAEVQQYESWIEACICRMYDVVVDADDGSLGREMLLVG